MGLVTFLLPNRLDENQSRTVAHAHFVATYDLIPVPTRVQLNGNTLALEKDGSESCYVELAWPIEGHGLVRLRTATLITRKQPYYLLQELCRGKLNQLRTRIAEWESAKFSLDSTFHDRLRQSIRRFNSSIDDPLGDAAIQSVLLVLRWAIELSETLLNEVTQHWKSLPSGKKSRCRIELAVDAIPATQWPESVRKQASALRIVPSWSRIEPTEYGFDWLEFDRLIEWGETTGLPLTIGPLFDFAQADFPDWLIQWTADLPSIAAYACDFAETFIRRYQSLPATWEIFHGMNHVDRLGMNEDARLQLAARMLDSARHTLPQGEWVIGITQPWGDYLLDDQYTYSPLIFVDTLIRAGFHIKELNLALDQSLLPNQDESRTPFDVVTLIDQFRQLGEPLKLTLTGDETEPTHPTIYDKSVAQTNLDLVHKLSEPLPQIAAISLTASPLSPEVRDFFQMLEQCRSS